MKSLVKKALPIALVLSSVAAIAAGVISKDQVNAKVATIVAASIMPNSNAKIEFTSLNVDTTRALDFGANVYLNKKGTANEVTVKMMNVEYHYNNGAPAAQGQASVETDLVKVMGQKSLNELAASLEEQVGQMGAGIGQEYGGAMTIDAKITELVKDQKGDVVSVKMTLKIAIDTAKLPQDKKVEDTEFKNASVIMSASRKGIALGFYVNMNPEYKGFDKDQTGLKEIIEKLLSEDKETYTSIGSFISTVDQFAESVVNTPSQQR